PLGHLDSEPRREPLGEVEGDPRVNPGALQVRHAPLSRLYKARSGNSRYGLHSQACGSRQLIQEVLDAHLPSIVKPLLARGLAHLRSVDVAVAAAMPHLDADQPSRPWRIPSEFRGNVAAPAAPSTCRALPWGFPRESAKAFLPIRRNHREFAVIR